MYYHNNRFFLVKIASIEDEDEVMYTGPHMMNNKPIIVKDWASEFDFSKEGL